MCKITHLRYHRRRQLTPTFTALTLRLTYPWRAFLPCSYYVPYARQGAPRACISVVLRSGIATQSSLGLARGCGVFLSPCRKRGASARTQEVVNGRRDMNTRTPKRTGKRIRKITGAQLCPPGWGRCRCHAATECARGGVKPTHWGT
jgi:hypothetical protein